jgi:glucan biosynthesis protein C
VDGLRVLLFAGLIAYHLGLVYAAWSPYALKSSHTAPWVEGLLLLTHPWRMCILFLISGVATRFAADRLGASRLLVSRSVQFLPPLLFGIVFLVPIQTYLTLVDTQGYAKGYFSYLPELLSHGHNVAVNRRTVAMPVYAHLWFVFYLWSYMLLLGVSLWVAPKWVGWVQAKLERVLSGAGLLLWPLAALVIVELTMFQPFGVTLHFHDDWYNHTICLGMFLFGFLVARSEALWDRFVQLRWVGLGFAVVGWGAYALLWGGQGIPEFAERTNPVMQFFYPIERWGAIVAVLGFARLHLTRTSGVVRYLNGGMFTYYIVHQPAMLLLLHQVAPLNLHAGLEAAIVLSGTVAVCGIAYELARGLGWFGLFMGVRPPGARLWKPAAPKWTAPQAALDSAH